MNAAPPVFQAQPVSDAVQPDTPGKLGIHLDAVLKILLARRLCLFERRFSVLHQFIGLLAVVGITGQAALDLRDDFVPVNTEWPFENTGYVMVQKAKFILQALRQRDTI